MAADAAALWKAPRSRCGEARARDTGSCDSLAPELPSDDEAAEAPVIKEFLDRMSGVIRWLPHDCSPADALKKLTCRYGKSCGAVAAFGAPRTSSP